MENDEKEEKYFKGRGSQVNTDNRFLKGTYVTEHIEGLDEPLLSDAKTQIFIETPKKIINVVGGFRKTLRIQIGSKRCFLTLLYL